MSKEEFVEVVAGDLPTPPNYFFHDANINKTGYVDIDKVMKRNKQPLGLSEMKKELSTGALILDCRTRESFEEGFIPGSIFISLTDVPFAVWVGTLLKPDDRLVLVTEPGKEEEAVLRLARVGYENVAGYLEGGINTWKAQNHDLGEYRKIPGKGIVDLLKGGDNHNVLDVRKKTEWAEGTAQQATLIELSKLSDNINILEKSQTWYVHCKGGPRARIAYSMMKRAGFDDVYVVEGGFDAMKAGGLEPKVPEV